MCVCVFGGWTRTELTAIYVTARTSDTQHAAKLDLDSARKNTDRSLTALAVWPPADSEATSHVSAMYRSRHMFAAILAGHRTAVHVGAYFWDEVDQHFIIIIIVATYNACGGIFSNAVIANCIQNMPVKEF